jgi:hypothetical protein
MRTTRACLACLASVLAVAPLLLTHCGGGSSSTNKLGSGSGSGSGGTTSGGGTGSSGGCSNDDDAAASSGGGSDNDGGSSGAAGVDGGAPGEGGAESGSGGSSSCQAPEGGAACDPGFVSCGSASCATATTYCCAATGDAGGSCDPYNGGTCTSAVKYQCDEAADCTSGVCCQPLELGPHSTSCMPSCTAGNFQVCRSDSECGTTSDAGAAHKCILQTCPTTTAGGGGFPGGGGAVTTASLEACAYPGAGGTWGPLPDCTAK